MYSYSFSIVDNFSNPLTAMMRALEATTVKASNLSLGLTGIGTAQKGLSAAILPTTEKLSVVQSPSGPGSLDADTLSTIAAKAKVPLSDLTAQFELLKSKGVLATAKDMEQFVVKLQQAKALTADVATAATTVKMDAATESVVTMRDRVGSVFTAALDVQRAFDYLQYPIAALPEHFETLKATIVDVSIAVKEGNWAMAAEGLTAGLSDTMTMVNEFRTSWQFVQQGFQSSKILFGETFTILKTGAMSSIAYVQAIGTTFLTSTLPAVLTFVGQSVIGLVSYTASLFGATAAQAGLNAMMLANPIGVIIIGIVALGAAVYGLITYWDEVKTFLGGMAKALWILNPFSWLSELVKTVFPNFYNGVTEWFGKAFAWIDSTLITPVKDFFGWLMTAPEKVMAVSQEVTDSYKKMFGVGQDSNLFGGKHDMTLLGVPEDEKGPLSINAKKPRDLGIKSRMNEVKGSDRQIKNINITINKLVEKVENKFENSNQFDGRKIQEAVNNALMGALNDFNYQ